MKAQSMRVLKFSVCFLPHEWWEITSQRRGAPLLTHNGISSSADISLRLISSCWRLTNWSSICNRGQMSIKHGHDSHFFPHFLHADMSIGGHVCLGHICNLEFCPLPSVLSARRSWQGLKALSSPPQRIPLRVIWYQAFPFGTNLLAGVSNLAVLRPKRPLKALQNI